MGANRAKWGELWSGYRLPGIEAIERKCNKLLNVLFGMQSDSPFAAAAVF